MSDTKPTNPKDAIGSTKVPLSLIPPVAKMWAALAHLDGAAKYGKWNWRAAGVRTSIYLDAMHRHLDKLNDGEWNDDESMLPHLAHIIACANILLDAQSVRMLVDDRPPRGPVSYMMPFGHDHVARIIAKYEERTPHHYTLADPVPGPSTTDADPAGPVAPETPDTTRTA